MLNELKHGESRGFDPFKLGRDTIFVVRKEFEVYGYRNSCPHIDGAPLAWRKDRYLNASGTHIVCFGHGAEFDISNGICILGPCQGESLETAELIIDPTGAILFIK
jgi:nitrite reductase/ring-hydroxylating ferredoxin subunit